ADRETAQGGHIESPIDLEITFNGHAAVAALIELSSSVDRETALIGLVAGSSHVQGSAIQAEATPIEHFSPGAHAETARDLHGAASGRREGPSLTDHEAAQAIAGGGREHIQGAAPLDAETAEVLDRAAIIDEQAVTGHVHGAGIGDSALHTHPAQ